MSSLDEVYASAGRDVIIRCLEITSAGWEEPVFICNGFEDQTVVTEDGRTITFIAANVDIQLAKKNNKGNQTLSFAVDNTTGAVQRKVYEALESDTRVSVVYRTYLDSNLSAPAEKPYTLTMQGGSIQGSDAQLQCAFFDLLGVAWPRDLYTLIFAPAFKYN